MMSKPAATAAEVEFVVDCFVSDFFGSKLAVLRHQAIKIHGNDWKPIDRRREPRPLPADHVGRGD